MLARDIICERVMAKNRFKNMLARYEVRQGIVVDASFGGGAIHHVGGFANAKRAASYRSDIIKLSKVTGD